MTEENKPLPGRGYVSPKITLEGDPAQVRAFLACVSEEVRRPMCDGLDCEQRAHYRGWLGKSGADVRLCGFHFTQFARGYAICHPCEFPDKHQGKKQAFRRMALAIDPVRGPHYWSARLSPPVVKTLEEYYDFEPVGLDSYHLIVRRKGETVGVFLQGTADAIGYTLVMGQPQVEPNEHEAYMLKQKVK